MPSFDSTTKIPVSVNSSNDPLSTPRQRPITLSGTMIFGPLAQLTDMHNTNPMRATIPMARTATESQIFARRKQSCFPS